MNSQIEDLIRFENECNYLDFKAVQYKKVANAGKNVHVDFLKDVLSMANADVSGNRYIITGVKVNPDGSRDIIGLQEGLVDAATYQQLVNDNIEPALALEYNPYIIDGQTVGVFVIGSCVDPPYVMKKDFDQLRKGDIFIRKGSHQTRAGRTDLDRMNETKVEGFFSGEITITYDNSGTQEYVMPVLKNLKLPSEKAREEYEWAIAYHQSHDENKVTAGEVARAFKTAGNPHTFTSLDSLKEELENVNEIYLDHDIYYVLEEKAQKINLIIANISTLYIEDASIELIIPKIEGLVIAKKVISKPKSAHELILAAPFIVPGKLSIYPSIIEDNACYRVKQDIGNVKHLQPVEAFKSPIRMTATENINQSSIKIQCRIYGRNLKKPIEKELVIHFAKA